MPDFPSPLESFQTIVLTEPTLQHELRRAPDRVSFIALAVKRARERGCALDAAEIEAALAAAARDWALRWIVR
ncbi:hypothetical protein SAMN05519104_1094 [Rhizobiales bacterium GAS188]|nr:hypothetical protein SAMN05519104_1094 [Rhizobiales bacterium GAS188]